MADLSQYGGLDPSLVGYLQGGGMPSGIPASQQVSTVEYPQTLPLPPLPSPSPPPPPPPPPQQIGAAGGAPNEETPSYGLPPNVVSAPPPAPNLNLPPMQAPPPNAGADLSASPPSYWPPPPVVAGVQNGFAPQSTPSPSPADTRLSAALATPPNPSSQLAPAQTKAQQQFAASPEGIAEQADAEKRGALVQAGQANADAYAAEAAQNDAKAAAMQASADRQAQQAKIDAEKNAQDQANVAKYTQQYAQQVKDAAKYAVDTDRHIGVGGIVAIALSGIGDALDHRNGPNSALQIINNGIDKRIADQWAQKRALGDKATQTKDVLDTYRQNADDDRQAQQFQRAADRQATADQIDLMAAKTADPIAKAKMEATSAQLRAQSADITQGEATRKVAAQRAQSEDYFKSATLGVEYGNLAIAQQQQQYAKQASDREFGLKIAELQAAGQQAQAAALQKQAQEAQERGMAVPTKINPDGSQEYQFLKNQDGSTWTAPSGQTGEDLAKEKGATLNAVQGIDQLRMLRAQFGSDSQAWNTIASDEPARQLIQRQAQVIVDMHKAFGITRMSDEVLAMFKKMATGGIDADSVKGMMQELDNTRGLVLDHLEGDLRGTGNYTGKKSLRDIYIDPLKHVNTASLGEKLTQPYGAPSDEASSPQTPMTNTPSIVGNFGRTVVPTIATGTPAAAIPSWHQYVINKIHENQ